MKKKINDVRLTMLYLQQEVNNDLGICVLNLQFIQV